MDFSLNQTFDIELIAAIMALPEVMDKASNQAVDFYIPDVSDSSGWFVGFCDGRLSGIINATHINANTIEIHPYCLDAKSSRMMISEFYKIFLKFPKDLNKIICRIPESFTKTVNFAKRLGFIDEGFLKESYNVDGEFVGVHVLGITRQEIEVYLNG